MLLALSLAGQAPALYAAQDSANATTQSASGKDSESLEPLLIEGQVMEFTKQQFMEIRTRILAEGLKNPRGCSEAMMPLFVCRMKNLPASHLKSVQCGLNADYCASVNGLQTAVVGASGQFAALDFALDRIVHDNFANYIERASYAKLKHQVDALPGKPEENMQRLESLVRGWPPVDQRPNAQTLKRFARAYVNVAEIGLRMDSLIEQAGSADQRDAAQRRENEAFGKAITDQGLSAEQYNRISDATQRYFLLKKAVVRYIKAARAQRSSHGLAEAS